MRNDADDATRRAQYLPPKHTLQDSADAELVKRSHLVFNAISIYGISLIIASSLLPLYGVLLSFYALNLYLFPLVFIVAVAAIVPDVPPRGSVNYLTFTLIVGAFGSLRIAWFRYEQFQHAPLEQALRVGSCLAFVLALCYLAMTLHTSGGALFWPGARLCLAGVNAARLAACIILRVGVTPPPRVYPPDLPFGLAILYSLLYLVLAAGGMPSVRVWLGKYTGATVVMLRLRDIKSGAASAWKERLKQDKGSDATPSRPSSRGQGTSRGGGGSRSEDRDTTMAYIEHLEQQADALKKHNDQQKQELAGWYQAVERSARRRGRRGKARGGW